MIGEYYDIERYILQREFSDVIEAFRNYDIPLERIVARHAQLLDLDLSMRQAAEEMRAETRALGQQLLFDEIRGQLTCLMRHGARIRIYGMQRCESCAGSHARVDFRVVRVWSKSTCIEYRMGGHTPRRIRCKLDDYRLRSKNGDDPTMLICIVSEAAVCLEEFNHVVRGASVLPRVLNDIVTAYVGVELMAVGGNVRFDIE